MENDKIILKGDGDDITVSVVEQTVVDGVTYLLVEDMSDSEDSNCFILKDISGENDIEANYVILDDDEEFDNMALIFKNILEKDDIELN